MHHDNSLVINQRARASIVLTLMSKAIATLEGTCQSLDPDVKIVEYLKPVVEKHITSIPTFDEVVKQLIASPFEMVRLYLRNRPKNRP